MPAVPAEIDVVVHLHGYSSGGDDPAQAHRGLGRASTSVRSTVPAEPGAPGPTLTVLPRGHFTGVEVGKDLPLHVPGAHDEGRA